MLIFFTLDKKRSKKGPLALNQLHNDLKVDVENKKFCALFFDEKTWPHIWFCFQSIKESISLSIFKLKILCNLNY